MADAEKKKKRLNVEFKSIPESLEEQFLKDFPSYVEGLVRGEPGGFVLTPQYGETAASWRMVVQSVAWAAANLLAAAALTRGADALRGLFFAAAVSQAIAAWGCWRCLVVLSRQREVS